jgi:hypothetical protein
MEMSALFIWEQVNPFITRITNNRSYVSRVECREHDGNSAFMTAQNHEGAIRHGLDSPQFLTQKKIWAWESPGDAIGRLTKYLT